MIRDVGVGQLVEELEERGARLPFEIGAFVALEACEGLLQDSVKLEPDDVRVTLEGSVVVAESAASAEPDEAARSLVSVLARLLVAAGPGVPPYLLDLVKDASTGDTPRGLRDLHDAIEASLIPINRSASRRVLARLVRESDRPPAMEASQVDAHRLDAELDELLKDPVVRTLDPTPARAPLQEPPEEELITEQIRVPRAVREESPASTETSVPIPEPASQAAVAVAKRARQAPEPVTATIRKWSREDEEATSEPAPEPSPVPVAATVSVSAPELETPTESVFGAGSVSSSESIPAQEPVPPRPSSPATPPQQANERPSLPQQPPKRRGGWGIWVLAAGLGLAAYGLHASGTLDPWLRPAPTAPAPAVGGTIDVAVNPPDAQVFVFVGRGPAVAHDLAVGATHEFIVFDQGLKPSRAIVQKGASWATTDAGPLYELAVQAQPAEPSSGATVLGSPQAESGATAPGPKGTIRVITNPPAAKVYRFVGTGPSVRIPVSSIHEGQEVLVYESGHETRRAVIGPSDWQRDAGADAYAATLQVALPALPPSSVAETLED